MTSSSQHCKEHDPITGKEFLRHFTRNFILGFSSMLIILLIGIIGFRYLEHEEWIDCYANAAMIVSGVGTLTVPQTTAGKCFAATYSILGGASFLLVVAVVFAPIFHWLFRRVKVEDREHLES